MGDKMELLSTTYLLNWISGEYKNRSSIMGIQSDQFYRKEKNTKALIFGEEIETLVGPAAGPHTQIAQNIIASYLCGGRFIELKTVQKMDKLEITKPCIDARDEGYNAEWSTELSLDEASAEYLKAWVIVHLLSALFSPNQEAPGGFVFNMSIGYDLAGIQSPAMDRYIERLISAEGDSMYGGILDEAGSFLATEKAKRFFGDNWEKAKKFLSLIPSKITRSVTLSTMHGCPPSEIEQICAYLLTEKKLNTYVKLNPTLLGYDKARRTLDSLGYSYIDLKRESFTKDLQMDDAIPMLRRLKKLSDSKQVLFGLKLSNTLGSRNTDGPLSGDEKYMSGRALYPLTVNLSSLLAAEFNGILPISFAGGISQYTVLDIAKTGIRPITVATSLLKPGGYPRLAKMAAITEEAWDTLPQSVDKDALKNLAESVLKSPYSRKEWRGFEKVAVEEPLPLTDCAIAPCTYACPIGQDAPEYIRLVSEKRYDEALALIYTKNPLPHITGYICDHQCMANCTRLDYDGAVKIRDIKRIAAEKGYFNYLSKQDTPDRSGPGAAVLGAGPSGLACAYFLRKAGINVTVFDREEKPGGIVTAVLPTYRIPETAVDKDISFLASQGVSFRFGTDPAPGYSKLFAEGYKALFMATGAWIEKEIDLGAPKDKVFGVIDFLRGLKKPGAKPALGKRVAVLGGGNSAMDGARSSLRQKGVERVYIIYRRTENELPADREEFDLAKQEGAVFMPLLQPLRFSGGVLVCAKMTLGDKGPDGRRAPVDSGETAEIPVDSIITALGEETDKAFLKDYGIELTERGNPKTVNGSYATSAAGVFCGGDLRRGASSVVKAIADGRGAAEEIITHITGRDGKRVLAEVFKKDQALKEISPSTSELMERHGLLYTAEVPERDEDLASREENRCLHCSILCGKCVEVCPNRANLAVTSEQGPFKDRFQIIHLDGPCNECGNCATFCPFDGRPYKDKLTLFFTEESFIGSDNNGAFFPDPSKPEAKLRLSGSTYLLDLTGAGKPVKKEKDFTELEKATWLLGAVYYDNSYIFGKGE